MCETSSSRRQANALMAVGSVGEAEREQTAWLLEAVDRVLMSIDKVLSCASLYRMAATAARAGWCSLPVMPMMKLQY